MERLPFTALLILSLAGPLSAPFEGSAQGSESSVHVLPPVLVRSDGIPELAGLSSHEAFGELESSGRGFREAFQRVPGLQMQESFGGIDPPRLSVRGSGLQSAPVSRGVQLWFDGYPLSFADGSFNLALVETAWLNRAEFVAGPAAGVPALGGGLAIWSSPGAFSGERSIRLGYGSDDERSIAAQGAARIGGSDVVGAGAATRLDGWRQRARQSRESALASVRIPAADGQASHSLRLYLTRPRIQIPGPLSKVDALEDPESLSPAVLRDRPQRDSEYAQLGWRYTRETSQGHASVGASASRYGDEFQQLLPNGVTSAAGFDASVFGNGRWRWDAAQPQRTDLRVLLQVGRRETRRYRNDAGRRGALMGDNRLVPYTANLALSHAVEFRDGLEFEAGASALHARREVGERFPASELRPSTELSVSDFAVSPRLSCSWKPAEEALLYASWSRSYEPPTFDDLLFPAGPLNARSLRSQSLDWQRAASWEAGARWSSERLTWTAAVYHADWENELLRLADPEGSPRGTVNAGETLHSGWQTSLDWLVVDRPSFSLRAWTVTMGNRIRFDSDPVYRDKRLAGVAPYLGALGARAETAGGWFVAPALRWQSGPTWADHDNTLSYGGFAVWAVELGRRHPKGWEFALSVDNVFDERYVTSTAGVVDRAPGGGAATLFLPGAARRFHVTIAYAW